MKLQLIENICKRVVSLVLLTGICLLYSKGIIPVYLIVLFLLSGTIIGFLFRAFLLVIKVILILSVMGMLVSLLKYKKHENRDIHPLSPDHAGRMARHKAHKTCQKTVPLHIGRTENNRPLPGAIKGHRVQSRQAETPERVFPRDLCITY